MKLVITIFFILFNVIAYSQSKKDISINQINNLKENGALIVRIHLDKKNIHLYRKTGKIKLANKLQNELDINNYVISLAFLNSTFDFCPVYIIDAKDYINVINGVKSGYFLNEDMEVDSSIVLNEDFYLFLDRGNSFKTSESQRLELSDAFVFRDSNLNLLSKPFPYFKRIFGQDFISYIGFFFSTRIKYKRDFNTVKQSNNKSITEGDNTLNYIKNKYGLIGNELRLPQNIIKLNYKLNKYYNKVNLN